MARPFKFCKKECQIKHKHRYYEREGGVTMPPAPVDTPKMPTSSEGVMDAAFPSLEEWKTTSSVPTPKESVAVQPPVQSNFGWAVILKSFNGLVPESHKEYRITDEEAKQVEGIINSTGIVVDPRQGEPIHLSFEVGVVLCFVPLVIGRLRPILEEVWKWIVKNKDDPQARFCNLCHKRAVIDAATNTPLHADGTELCK